MSYIPEALRKQVRKRAQNCCEYCLLPETDGFFSHEVDHIIAEKHRGETVLDNLCLSCLNCNRHKGSDIASYDIETQALTPLFHPVQDQWHEHFRLEGVFILPLTPVGRITVYLLQINSHERLLRREALREINLYPCS